MSLSYSDLLTALLKENPSQSDKCHQHKPFLGDNLDESHMYFRRGGPLQNIPQSDFWNNFDNDGPRIRSKRTQMLKRRKES